MKTDYQTIKVGLKDDVAVLTIDNPPVNQMSPQLMQDFPKRSERPLRTAR